MYIHDLCNIVFYKILPANFLAILHIMFEHYGQNLYNIIENYNISFRYIATLSPSYRFEFLLYWWYFAINYV